MIRSAVRKPLHLARFGSNPDATNGPSGGPAFLWRHLEVKVGEGRLATAETIGQVHEECKYSWAAGLFQVFRHHVTVACVQLARAVAYELHGFEVACRNSKRFRHAFGHGDNGRRE